MNKKIIHRLWVLVFALALPFVFGCTPENSGEESSASSEPRASMLDEIVRRGTLKVGMSTFEPWAMKDKNGELIGFEIDVARRLAGDMGVDIEFVPTQWSGIIPALLTGKFDVIIGGMSINADRNLKVNFSVPYDYSGMSIVASREFAPGYTSLDDFNKPEVVIVARLGTTAADAAKKFMPNAEIRLFDSEPLAFQELKNGNAHAMVSSAPFPGHRAAEYPDELYLPISGTFTFEPIGFALPKSDLDLLNYFNSWITVVDAEGWLEERKHYWFETLDWKDQI